MEAVRLGDTEAHLLDGVFTRGGRRIGVAKESLSRGGSPQSARVGYHTGGCRGCACSCVHCCSVRVRVWEGEWRCGSIPVEELPGERTQAAQWVDGEGDEDDVLCHELLHDPFATRGEFCLFIGLVGSHVLTSLAFLEMFVGSGRDG